MEMENLLNNKSSNFDIKKIPLIKCKKCGGFIFEKLYIVKEISGLELGYGAGTIPYPIDVMVCKKCGEVYEDFVEELGLNDESVINPKDDNKSNKKTTLILD